MNTLAACPVTDDRDQLYRAMAAAVASEHRKHGRTGVQRAAAAVRYLPVVLVPAAAAIWLHNLHALAVLL